jgi:hypothetical protein
MKKTVEVRMTDFVPDFIELMKADPGDKVFTHTRGAIKQIGAMYQMVWRKYAAGEMVVPGKPPINSKGKYTRSIQLDTSQMNMVSVYTDYPYHRYIEEGHDEIDLKTGLLAGPKARHGKNGPYNIVAFRHGVPGSDPHRNNPMPMQIYQFMKNVSDMADKDKEMGLSDRGGKTKVDSVFVMEKGKWKQYRRRYSWGASLSKTDMTGLRSKISTGYTWKSGKYAGMYQMQVSTGKAKRSEYITFRIVSAASDPRSWIVPERPPIPIRQATVDFVRPFAEDLIKNALEKDLS